MSDEGRVARLEQLVMEIEHRQSEFNDRLGELVAELSLVRSSVEAQQSQQRAS